MEDGRDRSAQYLTLPTRVSLIANRESTRSLDFLDRLSDLELGQFLLQPNAVLEAEAGASMGYPARGTCLVAFNDGNW